MLSLSWVGAVQWISILKYVDQNASQIRFQALFWSRSKQEGSEKSVTCEVRDVEHVLSQRCSVDLNNLFPHVGENALLVSFQALILIEILARQEQSKKVSSASFKTLNMRSNSAVWWILISMYLDEYASPVIFQAFSLIKISSRRDHFKKRFVRFETAAKRIWRSMYVDDKCHGCELASYYSDRDIIQARAVKKSVTCQVWDVELELSHCCSMDLNIVASGSKFYAY